MKNKVAAIILVSFMLSASLLSCGETKNPDVQTSPLESTSGGSDIETPNDFTYIDEYVASLAADNDFGGATFTVIGRSKAGFPEFEEMIGNPENDALFSRQQALEAAFNIKISNENVDSGDYDGPGAPTAQKVITSVNAGLTSYDLVDGNLMTCGQVMLNQKALKPVNNIEGLDLERGWWLNDIEEQLGIGGKLFFLTGKIAKSYYEAPAAILFSKKIVEDYNIDDPYELVKNGEWTFDKMAEIASKIPAGSGVYRYMGEATDGLGYYIGGGYTLSSRNESGDPIVPESLSAEAVGYIEKVSSVLGDTSISFNYDLHERYSYASSEDMPKKSEMFAGNNALFWSTGMGDASYMREYDVEFGILPMPKRDSAQENYISYEGAWGVSGFFVPYHVKDEAMVGYVAEAMAALSEKYLESTYYDKALIKGSVYDGESKEMLDIIYHTKVLDLVDTYRFGSSDEPIAKLIENNIMGVSHNLASAYGGNARIANRGISSLIKIIGSYD